MNTPLLITKADFTGRIDISSNLPDRRLNEHILHAQDFDLCDLMGDKFYYYFVSFFDSSGVISPAAPQAIKDLYTGGNYVVDTITYYYPGIKPVIVYFAGSRLVRGLDSHVTPTGIMQKMNDYAEHVSASSKNYTATQHANQALAYWNKNLAYMSNDKTLYPNFFDTNCGCGTSYRGGTRARTINL